MSTDYWDKDGDTPTPKFAVKCPFCGTEAKKAYVRMLDFKADEESGLRGYAMDSGYGCLRCGFNGLLFGVAVTEEQYNSTMEKNFGA